MTPLTQKYYFLQPGRVADLVLVDAPRWEHLVYQFGSQRDLIRGVVKKGRLVYERPQ